MKARVDFETLSSTVMATGAEVTEINDLGKLKTTVAGIAPGSLDWYMQLPVHVAARGDSVVERVRSFLQDGLLALFAAASTIPLCQLNVRHPGLRGSACRA
jgi:hypothetical protein